MKTSSAKAKGRRCAKRAKELMLEYSSVLASEDIVITSSGDTGEDLKLSPLAREQYPFNIECKNTERLQIWKALEQAGTHGTHTPLLIFTRNNADMYCSLKLEDLFKLIGKPQMEVVDENSLV